MSFDELKLLALLPAFYRIQDDGLAKQGGFTRGPLASLLAVLAEQVAVLEEDLEQLQDDAFIETCADWVVPYIGDLIGYKPLYGVAPRVANPRAEVAHTIAYRRRKGTALVLEQLARDVTGWNASAVEFFQRLITTQYMNHRRAWLHAAPDLRRWEPLYRVGTAFDTIPRTIDVRRIASRRGRHNIPNIGVFLWPLNAYTVTGSPAARVDDRRYRFSPLNHDQPLYSRPVTEDDITQLATPANVPLAIGRRVMHERKSDFYTETTLRKSLRLYVGTAEPLPPIAIADIRVCHLGDDGATWAHLPPAGEYAIDPVLGRLALPAGLPPNTRVSVDYHYAFGADLGGGEYERLNSFAEPATTTPVLVPQDQPTIQAALNALGGSGVVEITDSGRYEENLSIDVSANRRVELRAANGRRPTVILNAEFTLSGDTDSEIALNGLLISGHQLRAPATATNRLRRLHLKHCTLVPGRTLTSSGLPQSPVEAALVVDIADVQVRAERSIVGALRIASGTDCALKDCILDATAPSRVAHAALDGNSAGGPLSLDACTSIGKLHALKFPLISNSILLAELGSNDTWVAPIIAERRQQGCVRYSYVPPAARVPRRFRCVPGEDTVPSASVRFLSLRYGQAIYAWLGTSASTAIRTGADDEGEMGAYHHVQRPQRETNLRLRLNEYLRVGLEAGIFYET